MIRYNTGHKGKKGGGGIRINVSTEQSPNDRLLGLSAVGAYPGGYPFFFSTPRASLYTTSPPSRPGRASKAVCHSFLPARRSRTGHCAVSSNDNSRTSIQDNYRLFLSPSEPCGGLPSILPVRACVRFSITIFIQLFSTLGSNQQRLCFANLQCYTLRTASAQDESDRPPPSGARERNRLRTSKRG